MSQFSRRVAVAGVAALALAASLGAAGSASAVPTSPPSYVTSWLALSTGSSNTVRLVNASSGATTTTQTLTTSTSCAMNQGSKSLVEFTPSAGSQGVGLSAGSIGVREKKNAAGTSCSAVDTASGESLTLRLQGGVGGQVAAAASLDINLKQSARILATARLSTAPDKPPALFELQSGTSIGTTPTAGAKVFTCNNPADSGPDSGTSNNCRWEISAPSWTSLAEDGVVFDSLELKALNGSFSLMGGADGFVDDPTDPMPTYFGGDQDASIFELVDGTVLCGQTVQLRTSDTVLKSEWTRKDNFGNTLCVAYPYASSSGVDSNGKSYVEIVKPTDFQADSQATWVTTGTYTGGTIPTPTMDLTGDEIGAFTLQACNAAWYDSSGVFTGPTTTSPPPSNPYACLISVAKGKGGGSTKTAIYSVYVFGDARLGW